MKILLDFTMFHNYRFCTNLEPHTEYEISNPSLSIPV